MSLVQLPDVVETDCDLFLRVRDRLHQRGYESLRTLEISVELGVVIVHGTLPAYYLRQVAVECVRRVAGVNRFTDRIEVVYLSDNCPVKDISVCEPKTLTKSTEPRPGLVGHGASNRRPGAIPFSGSPASDFRQVRSCQCEQPVSDSTAYQSEQRHDLKRAATLDQIS